jgi:transposase InsO family protein
MRKLRQRALRGEEPRPVGRPRLPAGERLRVRSLVERERSLQGRTVGAPAILAALTRTGEQASRMLVEQELAELKRADRAAQRRLLERVRVGREILVRDAVWGEDTTHLGRLVNGLSVDGELIKDLGTLETVGLSVGASPLSQDLIRLLSQTAEDRGGWPLVWLGDMAAINRDATLRALLDSKRVVHLLSRVHTPTDNAATEHQHGEVKREAGLGKGVVLGSADEARERAEAARRVLDHGRLRATRGWRTAAELGRVLPRADALVDREAFFEAACSAMEVAARSATTKRAAQKARREAVFALLEQLGLQRTHVGLRPRVRPGPTACSAHADRVECPGARP